MVIAAILVMWPSLFVLIFISISSKSFRMKFGFKWPKIAEKNNF